ncbi:class I adenylate-forming enzyme family protein [Paenibacillus solisilvae]|uniref:Class I adenylate-forming enzyme family protein n=1 Tax=Paenibacillus solisilvae TaxID=2486751 RepID=A0ABW0W6U4_9BACL
MRGYWNNPGETTNALRDGWLHTGDIGKLDEDGYLYLLDRKKDMIIVNASNVYAPEVEEVLGKHPSIREAAIIGTPLPNEGEEVTAVVTLHPEFELTLEAVRHYCHDRLASFKIPTRLEIVTSLPRTTVGKLNKTALRQQYTPILL